MKMFLNLKTLTSNPLPARTLRQRLRYWEVVETVRRISFQSALAVIDTPTRRAFLGMILSIVFAIIYRELSPVRERGFCICLFYCRPIHILTRVTFAH